MPTIDVIIPYHQADRHLVCNAVTSILLQTDCSPIIHLVADNCDVTFIKNVYPVVHGFKPFALESYNHAKILYYSVPASGPYNIVNKVLPQCTSHYLALQDADDYSKPRRLSKAINLLNSGYVMVSTAMLQIAATNYTGARHLAEPVIYPGVKFSLAPMGRCINSTRTMLRSFFVEQNGFADMPCSGDFQFDNRCALQVPPPRIYHDQEILGIRYLYPTSLSNSPETGGGSAIRNAAAYAVAETITAMRRNPTLQQSQLLGDLTPVR